MTAITEELLRRRQASQVEALSKSQTNNAIVIEEVVEVRDTFASGTTDRDSRISLSSAIDSSSTPSRPLFLDAIKTPPQLKSIEATLNVEPVSLDVISSLKSNLKPSSKSILASSESVVKPTLYSQSNLKKTSGSAGLTSNGSIESANQAGGYKSTRVLPSQKEKVIQVNVPEADFSYVGIARIVKNKK